MAEQGQPQAATNGDARPEDADSASANAAMTQEASKPKEAEAKKDPTRELLERLQRLQPSLGDKDRGTRAAITYLVEQATDTAVLSEPSFRHRLAYTIQDVEKATGERVPMAPDLRWEMNARASSTPGLENERMLALMRMTGSLQDAALVRDIRRTGFEMGRGADQNGEDAKQSLDVLENRVRLSSRPAELTAQAGGKAAERVNAAPNREDSAAMAAARQTPATPGPALGNPTDGRTMPAGVAVSRSALDMLLAAMRGPGQGTSAPWDPLQTPLANRLSAFEQRMRDGQDSRALANAERNGRAALDAMDAFRTGEGATVMSRIREAAKADPGGMAGVLSEMREGRRFADLRQQFNNALETERGATAAYDKAAAALARYGQARAGVEAIIARRPDAANLSAKFERLDAEIGEAASATPSRRDGKSMMDDLAKSIAELLQRGIDGVKAMLSRASTAEATTRAAPSPSMSP